MLNIALFVCALWSLFALKRVRSQEFNASEYSALENLYNSTQGMYWTYHGAKDGHWNFSDAQPCLPFPWQGLTCDVFNKTVIKIILHDFNLTGIFPREFFKRLSQMVHFDASTNALAGSIPSELGGLTYLNFSYNKLSGPIPSELGGLTNLTHLDFYDNKLSGPIPSELGGLTSLTSLILASNKLSGPIPSELGGLTSLTYLILASNKLSGPIPSELGGLTSLTYLDFYDNKLSGPIPSELGGLTSLTYLILASNKLSGPIPPELGGLTSLTYLDFSYNKLSGPIPSELGGLTKLTVFILAKNLLKGKIPNMFGNMRGLLGLYISFNSLTGTLPSSTGNLANLTLLYCSQNILTGKIPESWGGMSSLTFLDISENEITGTIPNSLGNLTVLQELYFTSNRLSGELLNEMAGSWSSLKVALFHGNNFGGNIPSTWSQTLTTLDFSDNQFTGQIPYKVFELPKLLTFGSSSNCLSPVLPDSICQSSIQKLLLSGLGRSDKCTSARAVYTQLPSCIWSLRSLISLDLSGNAYAGQMKNMLSENLTELDLSYNRLRGVVPDFFNNRKMAHFDISHNMITGSLYHVNILPNSTSAVYKAEVNRLSGPLITSTILKFSSVSILQGGIFSCYTLPTNDKDFKNYVCGSEGLAFSMYYYLIIFALFVGLILYLRNGKTLSDIFYKWGSQTSRINFINSKTSNSMLHQTTLMHNSLGHLGNVGVKISSFVVIADFIIYAALKYGVPDNFYRTNYYQYLYVFSGAFLCKETPAFVLFVYQAVVVYMIVFAFCQVFYNQRPEKRSKPDVDIIVLQCLNSTKSCVIISCQVIGVLAFIMIPIMVNVGYVAIIDTFDVYAAAGIQLTLLIFNGTFRILLPSVISYLFQKGGLVLHDTISECVTGGVLTFLDIAVPFFATLYQSDLCLHDAVITPAPIPASYTSQECMLFNLNRECVEYEKVYEKVYFTPPFLYSSVCRNAVIRNYLPIVVYSSAFQAFASPVMYFFLTYNIDNLTDEVKILCFSVKTSTLILPGLMYSLHILCGEFILLLTYGIISPYAAVAIGANIFSQAYVVQIFIRRYCYFQFHHHSDEKVVSRDNENIESICEDCIKKLPAIIWPGIVISSIWFSLYLFEMAYDTESESLVAPIIVMILTLIVAPCAWMVLRCYQKFLTNPAETQEVQPTNELELGEASIVHNPLSAPTQVQLSERTLDLSSVTVLLTITYEDSYGKYHIKANGESQLSPENTRRRPTVSFNPRSGDVNYTLIMTNLDVLCSMEAICKEFIHWVVVNIPANGTVSDGDQICSYMGAAPYYNSGLQRYIFLLYSQEGNKLTRLQCQEAVQVFESRNVSLYGEWLQHLPSIYGANAAPVGFSAFRSGWTPYVDIVHETMMFMPPVPYRSPSQVSKTHAEAGRMQIEKWKTEFIGKKEEKTSDNERGDDRVYKSLHAAESEFGARIESISEQTSQAPANSDESTNSMQKRYGTEYESIFGGRILHKKTANEMKYKKRYCWIEAKEKKLCWSKEGIRKKHKSVSLDSDITAINLLRNRISFSHILGRKSSVDLEIYGSSEDNAEAARWYEVAMDIYYKGKG